MPTITLKPGESTTAYVNGVLFAIRMTLTGKILYSRVSDQAGYTARLVNSLTDK